MVTIRSLKLAGVAEITATPFTDERGFLARTWDRTLFAEAGFIADWEQESRSFTDKAYTLRGLHVHLPPFIEGKLIQPLHGVMRWVVVDLRDGSATFTQWASIDLDGQKKHALYVAPGFAHGCVSLTDQCDLIIKSNQPHSPAHSSGIRWDDPRLAIDWGVEGVEPLLSEAHRNYASFDDFEKEHGALVVEK